MIRDDDTLGPDSEDAHEPEDRSQPGGASTEHDPASKPVPPSNPETDREAVEKGEEQIGRVVGR